MTGAEWYKLFQVQYGQAYTGYLDPTKRNRILKNAVYKAIEATYKLLDTQTRYDSLRSFVTTNKTVVPVANQVNIFGSTAPALLNYQHLLYLSATFLIEQPKIIIEDTNSAGNAIIYTSWYTNLREGQRVIIANSGGNTAINGTVYLKKAGKFAWGIYTDSNLLVPVKSNGIYQGEAQVYFIYESLTKQLVSDQKGVSLEAATVEYPKHEIADGKIKIYPLETPCSLITTDYITTAINPYGWSVPIDTSDDNAAHDIELIYPYVFLNGTIMDFFAKEFDRNTKDTEGSRQDIADLQNDL